MRPDAVIIHAHISLLQIIENRVQWKTKWDAIQYYLKAVIE